MKIKNKILSAVLANSYITKGGDNKKIVSEIINDRRREGEK